MQQFSSLVSHMIYGVHGNKLELACVYIMLTEWIVKAHGPGRAISSKHPFSILFIILESLAGELCRSVLSGTDKVWLIALSLIVFRCIPPVILKRQFDGPVQATKLREWLRNFKEWHLTSVWWRATGANVAEIFEIPYNPINSQGVLTMVSKSTPKVLTQRDNHKLECRWLLIGCWIV